MENLSRATTNLKKVGRTVLISGRVGFRTRNKPRDKEGHFIIIKKT